MVFLLVIIYITFISLGLPDSMLGTCWPVIYRDMSWDINFASVISMLTLISTSFAGFIAGRFVRRYSTFFVTTVSILFTIIGMIGIAISRNISVFMFFSIILGIGGGAIDAALNAFISSHYEARHMNWLHAFWGIGIMLSPALTSFLLKNGNWRYSYLLISALQTIIFLFVFIYKKKWDVVDENLGYDIDEIKNASTLKIISERGVKLSALCSGLYSILEFTLVNWGATYLVLYLHLQVDNAAITMSIYYLGITLGRIVAGILSHKISDNKHINFGLTMSFIGLFTMAILKNNYVFIAFLVVGFGYGPIFPSQLHRIPTMFDEKFAVDIIGFQMAISYTLGFFGQLIISYIASKTSFAIIPYTLLCINILLFILNRVLTKTKSTNC